MVRSLAVPRLLTASFLFVFFTLSPVASHAQEVSSLPAQEISSAPEPAQSSSNTPSSRYSTNATPDPADLEVSWRKMPARFLHDEKDMWLFPVKLRHGKNWIPTAIVVGGTAVFIKEDPPLERKVRQTDIFGEYNKVLKSSVSGGIIVVVPVGFYAISLLRHDSYGQGTALLAKRSRTTQYS